MIEWTTKAWRSFSASVIMSGFKHAHFDDSRGVADTENLCRLSTDINTEIAGQNDLIARLEELCAIDSTVNESEDIVDADEPESYELGPNAK